MPDETIYTSQSIRDIIERFNTVNPSKTDIAVCHWSSERQRWFSNDRDHDTVRCMLQQAASDREKLESVVKLCNEFDRANTCVNNGCTKYANPTLKLAIDQILKSAVENVPSNNKKDTNNEQRRNPQEN